MNVVSQITWINTKISNERKNKMTSKALLCSSNIAPTNGKCYLRHYGKNLDVTNKFIFPFGRSVHQLYVYTYPHTLIANHILILAYEESTNDDLLCLRHL